MQWWFRTAPTWVVGRAVLLCCVVNNVVVLGVWRGLFPVVQAVLTTSALVLDQMTADVAEAEVLRVVCSVCIVGPSSCKLRRC